MTDFQRDVYLLLGLPVDAVTMDDTVVQVRRAAEKRHPCFISTPNLNFAIAALGDGEFRDSVICSDLSLADGTPLLWAARLCGVPIRERVAGSSLIERLRKGGSRRLSIFLFGGAEGAAQSACERLNGEQGGLRCAGFESPGFGSVEEMSREDSIRRINSSGADFLLVALGAKKGQAWIARNRSRLTVPLVSHLGATLNFVAGTVRRAPGWMQRTGVEWLWRIREEPALWRRYWHDGIALLALSCTRLLPYAFYAALHRPNPAQLGAAVVRVSRDNEWCVVELRGAWMYTNIAALRQCFARVTREPCDLRIDLGQVTYGDCAFFGLLSLLYGHQKQAARKFVLSSPSGAIERLLRYSCAEFLCEATPPPGVSWRTGAASS